MTVPVRTYSRNAVAMVWDDRPGGLPGLRAVANLTRQCDRCLARFFSDGLPAGSTPDEHDSVPDCTMQSRCLFEPGVGSTDRSTQTYFHYAPFFDPTEARALLRDFAEYPSASAALCRFIAGAAERCPGEPRP